MKLKNPAVFLVVVLVIIDVILTLYFWVWLLL
jgi:hypothetical protein